MSDVYTPTARTTATRNRDRMHYGRPAAHAILDEAYDCAVGFLVDGGPRVLPTLHVRMGDTVYLHASTGGRLALTARGGAVPVCVTVTLLDGLVYGRSQFHHSANYRSVVILGDARPVTDPAEKRRAMTALVERTGPGRAADSRPPDDRELGMTAVLAVRLTEVSVRARTGDVVDDPGDLGLPHWAGVVPLHRVPGVPEPAAGVTALPPAYLPGRPPPAAALPGPSPALLPGPAPVGRWQGSARPVVRDDPASPWHTAVELRGRHVHLLPLAMSHVDGLGAALDDDAVWEFLTVPRPAGRADMAAVVSSALDAQRRGERVAWVQCDPVTGAPIGTTMYHDIDDAGRALGIGHTMLGRDRWRSGVNTEAKLMLLTRAFETLGVQRVFWYTDVRNERSQRAIARLGASRDGLIRRHRLRPDGTWRDSVMFAMTADEWPAAAARLRERLAAA